MSLNHQVHSILLSRTAGISKRRRSKRIIQHCQWHTSLLAKNSSKNNPILRESERSKVSKSGFLESHLKRRLLVNGIYPDPVHDEPVRVLSPRFLSRLYIIAILRPTERTNRFKAH